MGGLFPASDTSRETGHTNTEWNRIVLGTPTSTGSVGSENHDGGAVLGVVADPMLAAATITAEALLNAGKAEKPTERLRGERKKELSTTNQPQQRQRLFLTVSRERRCEASWPASSTFRGRG